MIAYLYGKISEWTEMAGLFDSVLRHVCEASETLLEE
jgi:hypothetical protein